MNMELYKTGCEGCRPGMPTDFRMREELLVKERKSFFGIKVDEESNGHNVKKQLRCTISGCFDKNNICCKACDIKKKCRYKCNFLDEEECPHQKWE